MLSLTFKKLAAVKGQNLVLVGSFTANMLSEAENNTKHSSFSNSSFKNPS